MRLFFVFLSSFLYSYSDFDIANSIKKQAIINNIDQRIIYTIAKIESGFNPFIISFTANHKNFKFPNFKITIQKYKTKYLISISSNNKYKLSKIANYLINKGYKVDIGLMQINSVNFNNLELNQMFELDYNISKSIIVLNQCRNRMKDLKNTIECYNKGFKKTNSKDYYTKFKNSFIKDFG